VFNNSAGVGVVKAPSPWQRPPACHGGRSTPAADAQWLKESAFLFAPLSFFFLPPSFRFFVRVRLGAMRSPRAKLGQSAATKAHTAGIPVSCSCKGNASRIPGSEWQAPSHALIFRYALVAPCHDRGPWLELSAGKRNMRNSRNVPSAPHRAMSAHCRQSAAAATTTTATTAALNTSVRCLGCGLGRVACIVDGCAVSSAARSVGASHRWLSIHHSQRLPWWNPLGRSDSARCDFVIGPARSTAAQACCAPICDVGPLAERQGDMSMSRPSHRQSSRCSPQTHAATPLLLDLSCLVR
jgi:hypothetical protein